MAIPLRCLSSSFLGSFGLVPSSEVVTKVYARASATPHRKKSHLGCSGPEGDWQRGWLSFPPDNLSPCFSLSRHQKIVGSPLRQPLDIPFPNLCPHPSSRQLPCQITFPSWMPDSYVQRAFMMKGPWGFPTPEEPTHGQVCPSPGNYLNM